MDHPILQLVVLLGVGFYLIYFGRSTHSQPEAVRDRWFRSMPDRAWASRLLRGFAVFSIFAGFLLISQGVTALPFLSEYRGLGLLVLVLLVAVAATALVVSNPRRRQYKMR